MVLAINKSPAHAPRSGTTRPKGDRSRLHGHGQHFEIARRQDVGAAEGAEFGAEDPELGKSRLLQQPAQFGGDVPALVAVQLDGVALIVARRQPRAHAEGQRVEVVVRARARPAGLILEGRDRTAEWAQAVECRHDEFPAGTKGAESAARDLEIHLIHLHEREGAFADQNSQSEPAEERHGPRVAGEEVGSHPCGRGLGPGPIGSPCSR